MIFLGLGSLGMNFWWGFQTGSMPLFLRSLTDSKFKISVVISLSGLAGCIVPPVIGYLSDKTRTRFGRRKPYIFLGMLGVFLSLVFLPHMTVFGIAAFVSGMMYFSLRVAETPYMSLLPDITPPEQRGTTSGVQHLLMSIGMISYFIASAMIWDKNPRVVFVLVALVSFAFSVATIILIREPDVLQEHRAPTMSPIRYLKSVMRETNALKFFAAQFFWWLGLSVGSYFLTLFVVEELNGTEGDSHLVLMVFAITATIFVVPLGMLGDRFSRKRILSVMLAFWAVAVFLIGYSQNLMHALITVGLTGVPYATVLGVGYAYMLDLIPEERTAEFVGLSVISMAVPLFLGPLIGGRLIDMFGYRSIFPTSSAFMVASLIALEFTRIPRRNNRE